MPSEESNNKSEGAIEKAITKTLEVTNDSGVTNKHPSKEKMNRVIEFLNKL